jgi:hypothetical protein
MYTYLNYVNMLRVAVKGGSWMDFSFCIFSFLLRNVIISAMKTHSDFISGITSRVFGSRCFTVGIV